MLEWLRLIVESRLHDGGYADYESLAAAVAELHSRAAAGGAIAVVILIVGGLLAYRARRQERNQI